jgi:hypothetical protein
MIELPVGSAPRHDDIGSIKMTDGPHYLPPPVVKSARYEMKNPTTSFDHPLRPMRRADVLPAEGFTLVIDNRFKTQFDDESAARDAAADLLNRYKMLQIEIYDAAKKERVKVS